MSRRKVLFGAAAGAVVVAGGGVAWWLNRDEEISEPNTLTPTWTAALPPFGEAVMTRVVGAVVLVVQRKGLAAFDRSTGAELWRRDTADEVTTAFGAEGAGPEEAAYYARVAGDVCVVPRFDETGLGATSFEVLSLATGEPRYTVERDGAEGVEVEVTVTTLVVRRWSGDDGQRFTAHTLTDGEELWSRELDVYASMPMPYSLRNQLVDVPSTGPLVLAPATDLALIDGKSTVTVFSLADGKDVASWDYPQDSNGGLTVVGGYLVSDGNEGELKGYDRQTGKTLWTRETLRDFGAEVPRDVFSLTGDLLMDADEKGAHVRIDLRTGEVVEYPDLGGRKLLAVENGVAALDEGKGEVVAFDVAGGERWRRSLGGGRAVCGDG